MSERRELTLEDVESAIFVLREFMRKYRGARSVLAQLGIREGREGAMPTTPEGFMKWIMSGVQQQQQAKTGQVSEPEPVASEEDLKRMKEITEKRKGQQTK